MLSFSCEQGASCYGLHGLSAPSTTAALNPNGPPENTVSPASPLAFLSAPPPPAGRGGSQACRCHSNDVALFLFDLETAHFARTYYTIAKMPLNFP